MPRTSSLTAILALAVLLTLSACTRVVTVRTPVEDLPAASLDAAGDGDAWWTIAFTLRWDREEAADWHLDALLADQVCAPALATQRSQVRLWRFHRRAGRDDTGHRFSLRVYTDELTADSLYERVRENSVLQWLESDERVTSVTLTRMRGPGAPSIAGSSDSAWPPEIQESWPWYIMGVSQTWLSLINQVKAEDPLEDTSTAALLDYYETVNDRVSALWRGHGQHVYLHHLNALFGYAPLVIRETNLKRF